jgi:hypothetical protein
MPPVMALPSVKQSLWLWAAALVCAMASATVCGKVTVTAMAWL